MKPKNRIRLIGRRELASLPGLGMFDVEAKIDTGAYTASMHCENIEVNYENSKPILYFTLGQIREGQPVFRTLRFEEFTTKKIKNSFGEMEERFVIKTLIHIGKKKIRSEISLSNRDNMRYPLLIGRRLLKNKFVVDVNQIYTGGLQLKKALNQLNQANKL